MRAQKGWIGALLLMLSGWAAAHGLLVRAESDGPRVTGTVYYTDGTVAADEYIELRRAHDADPALPPTDSTQTDSDGRFILSGNPGEAYHLIAFGEEGHSTTLALTLEAGARARLIDEAAEGDDAGLPAWMVLGGLLLLSLIPAFWLRYTRRSR